MTCTFGVKTLSVDSMNLRTPIGQALRRAAFQKGVGEGFGPQYEHNSLRELLLQTSKFVTQGLTTLPGMGGFGKLYEDVRAGLGKIILIDCRGFADPNRYQQDNYSRQHIGTSEANLQDMSQHDHWSGLIVEIAHQIKAARSELLRHVAALPQETQGRLWVFFYCQAGKHRSVGAEFVARHLLLKTNLGVIGPHHLSSGHWCRNTCNGCTECHRGPEQSEVKRNIIERTYREDWRLIFR
jgi:hypothetical protein